MDAVLGGSLQRAGETVRIRVQLSSGTSGQALWARSYDGELRTILGLQDEVARSVADRIRVSVTAEERSRLSAARPAVSPAAYQAYVRGGTSSSRVSRGGFPSGDRLLPTGDRGGSRLSGAIRRTGRELRRVGLLCTGTRDGGVSPGPRRGAQGPRAGFDARGGPRDSRRHQHRIHLGLSCGGARLQARVGAEPTLLRGVTSPSASTSQLWEESTRRSPR